MRRAVVRAGARGGRWLLPWLSLARVGIVGRLSIAFLAVAALAVTTNLIAEHGESIIRTTTVERVKQAPAPAPKPVQRVRPAPAPPPIEVEPAKPTPIASGPLLAALVRFDRAIERREVSTDADAAEQLRSTTRELRSQTAAFSDAAKEQSASSGSLAKLNTRSTDLRKHADERIAAADSRSRQLGEYWDHFEQVDTRVKGSLDKNFKIFGRVLARQSLIALSRELDTIRRDSARLGPAGHFDANLLSALEQSQTRFATGLDENAKGLGRSQGSEWLDGLRAEFAKVMELRAALQASDEQVLAAGAAMDKDINDLTLHIRAMSRGTARSDAARASANVPAAVAVPAASSNALTAPATPAVGETVRTKPLTVVAPTTASSSLAPISPQSAPVTRPGAGDAPSTGAAQTATAAAPAPVEQSRTVTTTRSDDSGSRFAIAAISLAVLALLLAICVGTVRSIVRPIRQFILTTQKLSVGDADARVGRGGIRELDTLAVAFNDMADKLGAAQFAMREYQGQLEARVDERTRQLQHLAEHDPLTGLPNRRQLVTFLNAALREAASARRQVGVFFLDLDNFKNINDSMGHTFGDRVLNAIAERLRETTSAVGYASRLGGDEFTVVYANATSVEDISRLGNELVHAFQRPLLVDGRELLIGLSVGASIFPDHERDADALLQAADAALFQAKTSGRSQLCMFNPQLLEAASLKFRIEQGLRRAVDRGEFELLFQPEVRFGSMDTQLVEALLRWRLPDGRNVSPAEFLAVAEESGLINTISDWVLSSAIETAARWHHGVWPEVRIAVNVSARQLLDPSFVDRVRELLAAHDLPVQCLEIELTENVLQTGPATIDTLRRLRELGIAVALDDFGTGYSSLASLEKLPLTRVKLDRSLIASIHTSARSLAIAQAIVALCRSLGLAVTAEGIESSEQLSLLLEFPSLCLQGYLFSPPITAAELPEALTRMPGHLHSLLLSAPPMTLPHPIRALSETHPGLEPEADLPVVRHAVKGS